MITGEITAVFTTKDFANFKEAIQHLDIDLFKKMDMDYEMCGNVKGKLSAIDITKLIIHDNPEDDEE